LVDNAIAFSDERVSGDSFAKLKPALHFGQIPVLYDNGFQIPQSNTILRHLGRKYNLYGTNEQEATRLDFINDGVEDVRVAYLKIIYQQWENKEAFLANLTNTLASLEKLMDGANYIVGNKPNYTDYSLWEVLDTLLILSSTALDGSPNLKAFHDRVAARPNIKAYLNSEQHPTTVNGNGKQ